SFPHQMHAMNLNNVMAIRPRMTVPGSAGFRFAGVGMEWCNAFLFPMSRERFVADLARLAPELKTRIANPGDVFEIDRGTVKHHVAASPIARTLDDDTPLLQFDTTAPIPPLQASNPGVRSPGRRRLPQAARDVRDRDRVRRPQGALGPPGVRSRGAGDHALRGPLP